MHTSQALVTFVRILLSKYIITIPRKKTQENGLEIKTLGAAWWWWYMLLMSEVGRQRQAYLCELENSVVYIESSRTARAMSRDPVSKTEQNETSSALEKM